MSQRPLVLTRKMRKRVSRGLAGFYYGPVYTPSHADQIRANARRQYADNLARLNYCKKQFAELVAEYQEEIKAAQTPEKREALRRHFPRMHATRVAREIRAIRHRMRDALSSLYAVARVQSAPCWVTIRPECGRRPMHAQTRAAVASIRSIGHMRHLLKTGNVSHGTFDSITMGNVQVTQINHILCSQFRESLNEIRYRNPDVELPEGGAARLLFYMRGMRAMNYAISNPLGQPRARHALRGVLIDSPVRAELVNHGVPMQHQDHDGRVHLIRGAILRPLLAPLREELLLRKTPWKPRDVDPFVGLELEIVAVNCPGRAAMADRILVHDRNLSQYVNVGDDSSIRSDGEGIGLELRVIAPMSELPDVLKETERAMRQDGGFFVNASCGMHVHHDYRQRESGPQNNEHEHALRNLVCAMPLLANIVDPHRLHSNYCKPNKIADWSAAGGERDKYFAINHRSFHDRATLEIRLHHGFEDWQRAVNWIRLTRMIADHGDFPGPLRLIRHLEKKLEVPDDLHDYILREYRRWQPDKFNDGILLEKPESVLAPTIRASLRVDPWELEENTSETREQVAMLQREIEELRMRIEGRTAA